MLVGAGVVVGAFAEELNGVGESEKSVRESSRNTDLIVLHRGEHDAGPFAEMLRA